LHFFLTAFFLDNSILPYFVNYFKGELEFLEVTYIEKFEVYKESDPTVRITVTNGSFIMPDFNVVVTATYTVAWSGWQEFAPQGQNTGTWTYTAVTNTKMEGVQLYIRTKVMEPDIHQIKFVGWGKGIFTLEGVDIVIDWNSQTNECRIAPQSIGVENTYYKEDIVVCDVGYWTSNIHNFDSYPCTYNSDKGEFSFNIAYTLNSIMGQGKGFGFSMEYFKIDGFKDYSITEIVLGDFNEDKENGIGEQEFSVSSPDGENFRYTVVPSSYIKKDSDCIAICDSLQGEYSGKDGKVTVKDEGYYYIIAASYTDKGVKADWSVVGFYYSSDDNWKDIGVAKYRDDIIGPLFGLSNCTYTVEIQEHKTLSGFYRIKNAYGDNFLYSIFGTTREDVYIYINAMNPDSVSLQYPTTYQPTGLDFANYGEIKIGMISEGKSEDGVITFPRKGLLVVVDGTAYYANNNGRFYLELPNAVNDITDDEHGTLTISEKGMYAGGKVSVIPVADENYEIDNIICNCKGQNVDITYKNGVYSFTMPNGDVEISATFKFREDVLFEQYKEETKTKLIKLRNVRGNIVISSSTQVIYSSNTIIQNALNQLGEMEYNELLSLDEQKNDMDKIVSDTEKALGYDVLQTKYKQNFENRKVAVITTLNKMSANNPGLLDDYINQLNELEYDKYTHISEQYKTINQIFGDATKYYVSNRTKTFKVTTAKLN